MKKDLSSFALHLIAMGLMFCDHLWAVVPGNAWLTWIGRLAFPIFAFLTAEGYLHTRDFKKYARRMLLFALISEIPFNFMSYFSFVFPFHQNVLWTFLLALYAMRSLDKARGRLSGLVGIAAQVGIVAGFYLLALLSMADYGGWGVLTVLVFYFLRGTGWQWKAAQFAAMFYIHWLSIGSMRIPIFDGALEIPQQGMAVLALIPIWLYKGRQGRYDANVRALYYWFYPAHMLVLALLQWIDFPA